MSSARFRLLLILPLLLCLAVAASLTGIFPAGAPDLLQAQQQSNGLGLNMGSLSRLSHARTRSISPENFTGEKGRGGMATEGTGAKAAVRPAPRRVLRSISASSAVLRGETPHL